MRKIAILGSTGSVGTNTLRVVEEFPDRFRVTALVAKSSVDLIIKQALRFNVPMIALADDDAAGSARARLAGMAIRVFQGESGIRELISESEADIVVSAMVGMAGLLPTLEAIRQGKDIAFANKEILVTAGELVMKEVARRGVRFLPVDSEISAIFQCLQGKQHNAEIRRLILTASGGPFRTLTAEELQSVTVDQALKHPNWSMGNKITIDSATLMNKGFEVIETKWLFGVDLDSIDVVVHPQSIVHSMVEFIDGSILAQLGVADMRTPIQYALSYPARLPAHDRFLDIHCMSDLTFESPDTTRFPCLSYAYEACRESGTMPAVLNAVDEVAVQSFLNGEIGFVGIPNLIRRVMDAHNNVKAPSLDEILDADAWARRLATSMIREEVK